MEVDIKKVSPPELIVQPNKQLGQYTYRTPLTLTLHDGQPLQR